MNARLVVGLPTWIFLPPPLLRFQVSVFRFQPWYFFALTPETRNLTPRPRALCLGFHILLENSGALLAEKLPNRQKEFLNIALQLIKYKDS